MEVQPLLTNSFTSSKLPLVEQQKLTFWQYAALAASALGLGIGVGVGLIGRAFSQDCTDACALDQEYQGCINYTEWTGIMLCLVFTPIGFYGLGGMILESANMKNRGYTVTVITLSMIAITCLLGVILTWVYLLKPNTVYDYVDSAQTTLVNDVLLVLIGGFLFFAFFPLGITTCFVVLDVAKQENAKANRSLPRANGRTNTPIAPSWSSKRWKAITLVVFLLLLAVACSSFSSVWNYSAHSYFKADSPYSLIHGRVNEWFAFKVYEDVVVYFSTLMGLVSVGCIALAFPAARMFLHRRFRIGGPGPYNPFRYGVTVGELIVLLYGFGMAVYWFVFWRYRYDRIVEETKGGKELDPVCCTHHESINMSVGNDIQDDGSCVRPNDPHADLQVWARVFGHMCTLCISFLLYPVSRNSLFEAIGVSYERSLKYHRALGRLAWVLITLHMLLWDIKWAKEGNLINNVFTINFLIIAERNIHWDNFTVLMMETMWLLLTLMVIIAQFYRRSSYELFKYTHQFAIVFLISAIVHAWSFWYYAAGGMILWLVDRCIRIRRGSRTIETVNLQYCPEADVTKVSVAGFPLEYYAGQYAFVHVAAISALEWHPFTISSNPSADGFTFHIKNMGSGTFTGKLADLARNKTQDIGLRIDGPYGNFDDVTHYRDVMFVAGGIGITPSHSMIAELFSRAKDGKDLGILKSVHLVWTIRNKALATMFSSLWDDINECNGVMNGIEFRISICCTGQPIDQPSAPCKCISLDEDADVATLATITQGRPTISENFRSLPRGPTTLIMACGPTGLIDDASELAFANGFSFHSEEFYF